MRDKNDEGERESPPSRPVTGGGAMAGAVLFCKDGTEYRAGEVVEFRAEEGAPYIGACAWRTRARACVLRA